MPVFLAEQALLVLPQGLNIVQHGRTPLAQKFPHYGFDLNRQSEEDAELRDYKLDWGPGDQVGDESGGWGWDVWKLWW